MHKVSYIALSFPMHFDAKDILMISIRQFGVSHVHVLLCLVEDPVGLWVSKHLFQTITLFFFLLDESISAHII